MKIDRAFKAGLKGGGRMPARVAVIDTGFWLDHPSIAHYNKKLSFNFVPGEKLMFNTNLTPDGSDLSHGTHTSSIIGGADLGGKGTIGVAPKADLVLLKVLGDGGYGDDHAILSAIAYAASDSVLADIINLSLGVTINKRGEPGSYTAADAQFIIEMWTRTMQYAYQQGTTVIGATGEDIDGGISLDQKANLALVDIPTSLPHVIGVSATGPVFWGRDQKTNLDAFAPYSWYGSKIIDFAAPGGNTEVSINHPGAQCTYKLRSKTTLSFACSNFDYVLSACCSKKTLFPRSEFNFATRYGWIAGTSMAAPHVAGVAALIVGKAGRRVSPDALLRHLKACTNDLGAAGKDAKYGNGRINAGKVVDLVL
ncbi:peptidase S8/S53 domain-containing protein [Tribonema minus]|uniref:subtilisin n=1 Tax=Tribonema minus TaxID=303371 RepID=A0A836CK69_9STRA|nr:peptidase S8/S53 domain-containing protein [Tribonema minus]